MMNSKQTKIIYRELRPEVETRCWSSTHNNCFRYSINETDEHIDKKFERFKYWRRLGATVFTELILNTGLRPDLVIVTDQKIFIEEVTQTESDESIELKKKEYPWELTRIRC